MSRKHTRRHYKLCVVCESGFYASRTDAKTCSETCRKRHERNTAYVRNKALHILSELNKLIELLDSEPYREEAWKYLVGINAHISKTISKRALADLLVTPESSQLELIRTG